MVNKKKFHGGLKVLLLLLFTMLLGNYSTCYASQPTLQELTNFFDFIKYKENNNEVIFWQKLNTDSNVLAQRLLNITQDYNYDIKNIVFIPTRYVRRYYSDSSIEAKGLIFIVNNTVGNELSYLELNYPLKVNNTTYSGQLQFSFRESIESTYAGTFFACYLDTNEYFQTSSPNPYSNIQLLSGFNLNTSGTLLNNNFIVTAVKTASFYWDYETTNTNLEPVLNNYSGTTYYDLFPIVTPTPIPTSIPNSNTGEITNLSGEITGQIDLSGIENGINQINNTISGEAQSIRDTISGETEKVIFSLTEVPSLSGENISSGDIVSALGFEFETDRYANFWYELTQGLKNAFLDSKRSIDVTFQNDTYTISLDDNFAIIPSWLQLILTPFTTCFLVWKLVKWWKLIIDKISSGNVDSILKDNAEEGISNLF